MAVTVGAILVPVSYMRAGGGEDALISGPGKRPAQHRRVIHPVALRVCDGTPEDLDLS